MGALYPCVQSADDAQVGLSKMAQCACTNSGACVLFYVQESGTDHKYDRKQCWMSLNWSLERDIMGYLGSLVLLDKWLLTRGYCNKNFVPVAYN